MCSFSDQLYLDIEEQEPRSCKCVSLLNLMSRYHSILDMIADSQTPISPSESIRSLRTLFVCKEMNVNFIRKQIASYTCQLPRDREKFIRELLFNTLPGASIHVLNNDTVYYEFSQQTMETLIRLSNDLMREMNRKLDCAYCSESFNHIDDENILVSLLISM